MSDETPTYQYSPPWKDVCIIGIAGSSGSGKSSLSHAIVSELNLPWVVILSMDSFYKTLDEEASRKAFLNEYDFDAPNAIDFGVLRDRLKDLKAGNRAEIPIYSFAKHARQKATTSIYSPHVLILEGIFALHDEEVLDLLDMKIFCEADLDTCLSRRILRDVKERDRDIEGCIKQWLAFVKPNFEKYVEPQRKVADIIVPRGLENRVAITMIIHFVERKLKEKSRNHQAALKLLGQEVATAALSPRVNVLEQTSQVRGMSTVLQDVATSPEDFVFYFDRLASLLIEQALSLGTFEPRAIVSPTNHRYEGLVPRGEVSAVLILRAGSAFSAALLRVIPSCRAGRLLIQSSVRTGEPELHYLALPQDVSSHSRVLLLDPQLTSGGAALMAVKVLIDHGVKEENIILVTCYAGRLGLGRLTKCWPSVSVVCCEIVEGKDWAPEERWLATRYFRC